MKRTWTRRSLLGLPVDLVRRADVLRLVPRLVRSRRAHHLCALNPIKVMRAQKEEDLFASIHDATLVYPDAVGIAWALRILYGDRVPVVPGCEVMGDLLWLASRAEYRVHLVGARPEILARVKARLARDYPGLRLVGAHDGYFPEAQRDALAQRVVASRPDVLLVAMGAQKQEAFVRAVQEAGGTGVMMTVGGSFDAFVGAVPRPPRWLLRLHLEWFYRLLKQPFRAPRMVALPQFACRVLRLRYAARRAV